MKRTKNLKLFGSLKKSLGQPKQVSPSLKHRKVQRPFTFKRFDREKSRALPGFFFALSQCSDLVGLLRLSGHFPAAIIPQ